MSNLDEQRLQVLIEEWKALAGYIDQGFHTLEKQSVYVVIILAAAAGVGATIGSEIPEEVWIFAPFAVLTLLFRLSSQITFAVFQSIRIIQIEQDVNSLLAATSDEQKLQSDTRYLWYGHVVQELGSSLGRIGAYAYLPWLWLQELLGLSIVGYATWRAVAGGCHPAVTGGYVYPFCSLVGIIAILWTYQLVALTVFYVKRLH